MISTCCGRQRYILILRHDFGAYYKNPLKRINTCCNGRDLRITEVPPLLVSLSSLWKTQHAGIIMLENSGNLMLITTFNAIFHGDVNPLFFC